MRGRKAWMCGEDFKIYAYDHTPIKCDGDDCYAFYDTPTGHIHVAKDIPQVMGQKAFHELVHKSLHGMSHNDSFAIFGDVPPDEQELREEALACLLEHKLYDLLVRNKWLRFPKPPKFEAK
jgi:hypothetical protein